MAKAGGLRLSEHLLHQPAQLEEAHAHVGGVQLIAGVFGILAKEGGTSPTEREEGEP